MSDIGLLKTSARPLLDTAIISFNLKQSRVTCQLFYKLLLRESLHDIPAVLAAENL